ncbi:MAG: nicotinate-nucleotide pyrophosphorylase [Candidatus Desulfovibrio kirbyi]|uniref:nicotinate-nucleotide diphosphorylase (carboxylating) n=1 Tax=Candidatus Desulfovibrio kirbyi TaxID=2696086 RepID=A0A6L2R4C9_9BACT|nr:MAG: nicotinate-nucleotide pyrophosphorylase [Candidatus Desulfovibrio kirbyi]
MFTPWARFFTAESHLLLQRIIDLAFAEDGPELTAQALFARRSILHARIRTKQDTIVVGLPIVGAVFKRLGVPFRWRALVPEASRAPAMTEVALIQAPSVYMLKAERVILNFITHLSGIANLTALYVNELEGTGVRLLDTRKTTPGLRWAEKYAVQAGGGTNHRKDLAELLMLKDNHIDAAGSITNAVAALRKQYRPCPPIEVECRTLEHVREAAILKVSRIMMDNMSDETLARALALTPPGIETEVSGGVTLETIRNIARLSPRKPDFISVGRITHSAPAADFSMTLGAP